jgi:hypothetical protein
VWRVAIGFRVDGGFIGQEQITGQFPILGHIPDLQDVRGIRGVRVVCQACGA